MRTDTYDPELKPCPFCGNAAHVAFWNGCEQAQCGGTDRNCPGVEALAPIDAWNLRTPPASAQSEANPDAMREALKGTAAVLAATISLLERGGRKSAPSDAMFDQMLIDYKSQLEKARYALVAPSAHSVGLEHGGCNAHRVPGLADGVQSEALYTMDQVRDYADAFHQSRLIVEQAARDDLSTLVRRLVRELRKASPSNDLSQKALDYLERAGLKPNVLRESAQSVEPYGYVYEFDGPFGTHRSFSPKERNARGPARTVMVYTAPPRASDVRDTELEEVADAIWQYRSGEIISAELMRDIAAICALVRNMKSKKGA